MEAEEIQVGLKQLQLGGGQRVLMACPNWHSRGEWDGPRLLVCWWGWGWEAPAVGLEVYDNKRQAGDYVQKGHIQPTCPWIEREIS